MQAEAGRTQTGHQGTVAYISRTLSRPTGLQMSPLLLCSYQLVLLTLHPGLQPMCAGWDS